MLLLTERFAAPAMKHPSKMPTRANIHSQAGQHQCLTYYVFSSYAMPTYRLPLSSKKLLSLNVKFGLRTQHLEIFINTLSRERKTIGGRSIKYRVRGTSFIGTSLLTYTIN